MARIDESRPFLPVNIAVLTVSDTRTEADDKSGRTLAELITRDSKADANEAVVRFEVDLSRTGNAQDLKGKTLTLTLVSSAGATETTWTLP